MAQTEILILESDAFCEHTMQQNTIATGASPGPRWGAYSAPPDPLAVFYGAASRRGGEVSWNGRRLSKTGPARNDGNQSQCRIGVTEAVQ